jgi:hypothetical protein
VASLDSVLPSLNTGTLNTCTNSNSVASLLPDVPFSPQNIYKQGQVGHLCHQRGWGVGGSAKTRLGAGRGPEEGQGPPV